MVAYFASGQAPNVGDGLVRPIVLAPKPSAGGAETCTCVVAHVDKAGDAHRALDVANNHEHRRHDANALVPNANQLLQ